MSQYEEYTYDSIMAQMMEKIPDGMDTSEGSFLWDACSRMAAFSEEIFEALDDVLDNMYPDTMDYDHLLEFGTEMGVPIREATFAQFKARFNCALEPGTRLQHTEEDLTYYVLSESDAANHIYIVEAEDGGTEPNGTLGEVEPIEYDEGFESGELTEQIVQGEEEENEDAYRYRILNSFGQKSFAGNRAYYAEKIGALSGVGGVKAYRVTDSDDTVRIVISGTDGTAPSSELIAEVQKEVDPTDKAGEGYGLAPIGAKVVVTGVATKPLAITAALTYTAGTGYDDLKDGISAAITEYLQALSKTWTETEEALLVRVSKIEVALLAIEGITDVEHLTIEGSESNYQLETDTIPVLGSFTAQ